MNYTLKRESGENEYAISRHRDITEFRRNCSSYASSFFSDHGADLYYIQGVGINRMIQSYDFTDKVGFGSLKKMLDVGLFQP